jgi:uncharacterized protein (TIGR00255 family)
MTAFGRGEETAEGYRFTVEIRSVNNRFCDVRVKSARKYNDFEEDIKRLVSTRFSRGRLEVNVSVDESLEKARNLSLDVELARTYGKLLVNLKDELGLEDNVDLGSLLNFRDIFVFREDPESRQRAWRVLEKALDQALNQCVQMRAEEGKAVTKDFEERLLVLESLSKEIEERSPLVVTEARDRLQKRIQDLLGEVELDEARLLQEVVIIADKGDITEELVRFQSHIQQFRDLLGTSGPHGRQLEFILQEMHREINTISSKPNDLAISQKVIQVKTELERLREQIQNVE